MGLFDRGEDYRLTDREPEKPKKERTVRPYAPPRPLSGLSCVLLLLLSAALLAYGAALLLLRFAGTETEAVLFTRLDAQGAVVPFRPAGITTAVDYTFADAAGRLHAGTASLFGNQTPLGETLPLRYLPALPALHVFSYRTEDILTPLGALLLGVILLLTAANRWRELRRGPAAEEDAKEREGT